MAWSETEKLTEGQKRAAEFAGIPADRPGLGAEYPKAVYKEDKGGKDRAYLDTHILVQGKYEVKTSTVNDAEEEAEAIAQGWALSPDMEAETVRRDIISEQAERIAELEAMVAAGSTADTLQAMMEHETPKRRGRPPLSVNTDI